MWEKFRALICAALLCAALPVTGETVSGAIRVIDGDTFDVGNARVRLFGVDAVESWQSCRTEQNVSWSCGAWVTERVSALYEGRRATCEVLDKHRGRLVARCFVDGTDVARVLVLAGLAFAARRFSLDYDLDEKAAAIADAGLHASRVQSPFQARQSRAEGRTPPDPGCRIKGNISSKGEKIYHRPGQRDYERTGIRADKEERWFCSAAEAEAAGWRPARR